MAQDFQRQVSERLLGLLDPLARVGLGKGYAQVFTCSLDLAVLALLGDFGFGSFGECVEVVDTLLEVLVLNAGLKSKLVQDGAREGDN